MAVVAFTSAKGRPGVTVAALAATLRWPRPVLLVEADVAGGSSISPDTCAGRSRTAAACWGCRWRCARAAARACGTRPCPRRGPLARPGRGQLRAGGQLGVAVGAAGQRADRPGCGRHRRGGGRRPVGGAFGPTLLLRLADAVVLVTRTNWRR